MSKLLNMSKEELVKIAEAINRNALENKAKSKEDRVGTDKFLRECFDIDRRDFSYTIKTLDVGIKYNKSISMYETGQDYKDNTTVATSKDEVAADSYSDNTKVVNYKNNTSVMNKKLNDAIPVLLEMVEWYKNKKDKDKNIVETQPIELNVNIPELSGAIGVHSVKAYEGVYEEFTKVCKQYGMYKKYDLVSLALLEFVRKYGK
ncbi:hypothetical protein ACJDU8_21690 [Clostridium sp. WILCCON 0269]|uniref:Uncharacterized protein n=1 Tax=Candidatus Clostridium eludens TaxID=3381663 RepID=A0ABW8SSP0_9CLOT